MGLVTVEQAAVAQNTKFVGLFAKKSAKYKLLINEVRSKLRT